MKIIQKTIKKAYNVWEPTKEVRCYHYAAAFNNNKMICFAQNDPNVLTNKAYKIGKKFNIKRYREYPYAHAESSLVSKLLHRYNTICPNWKIVVMRINRQGRILGSKPCCNCQKILDAVGLTDLYYSNDNGYFVKPKQTGST